MAVVEKAVKKQREKWKEGLVEVLKPEKPLNNEAWTLGIKITPTSGLDTDAIRKDMSPDWIAKYSKPGSRTEVTCTSLNGTDVRIKNVKFTDELCEELLTVVLKHAKRQAKGQ